MMKFDMRNTHHVLHPGAGPSPRYPGADVSRGPIQFLENNPIQSSFWVRFMCPKTRRNRLRLPDFKIPSGGPVATAALRRSTRGRRPPPFPRDSCVSSAVTVNLRSAASSAIIRTSEHCHVFSPPPRLSVRMFGSGWQERRNRVLELRRPCNRVARHPLAWSDGVGVENSNHFGHRFSPCFDVDGARRRFH